MAKDKKPVTTVTETDDAVAQERDLYRTLIRDNLKELFRLRYVLRQIPEKRLLAEDANALYEKFRNVLGDEGQELDKQFRGA